MNGLNSNFSLFDSPKAYKPINKGREKALENGMVAKRTDASNKYKKLHKKLSPMDQIDELGFSMQKLYPRSIGKEQRIGASVIESNYLNITQKRNRFANLKEMSKSHEVRLKIL